MSEIPARMRVAVYYRNHDVRIEERPVPQPGPGEILVKTEACGLCGGETMEWYLAARAPKVLGHEPAGVVAALGPGPARFKVGDRVFVHHHVPCMSCHHCNRGHFTLCDHFRQTAIDPGGFAEYFRVPAENTTHDTHLLPEHLTFEEATVIEPMACALKGLRLTPVHPGDTVAIVGMGFMGACYLQLILILPVGKVFALDPNPWRREKALALGATYALDPRDGAAAQALRDLNDGRGADAVFVVAPSLDAWQLGLELCERGARLHLGAPPPPGSTWEIDANARYFSELQTNSSYSAGHVDTAAVLDLLGSGRLDAKSLITHRFGLEGVEDAIRLHLTAGESLKAIVLPGLDAS
jgi:L-iditol 2-dehydrogenase